MQRILVVGAGFAGLWSAVGAARKLDELGIGPDRIEVLVINRTAWHSIRVRNYEVDLSQTRVLLSDVLDPIGVKHVKGEITEIDVVARTVTCLVEGAPRHFPYDRLVFAIGSRLVRPAIPGLEKHAFDVDTYEAAARLNDHIAALPSCPFCPGQYTV
jgi:NADH dehydrogenase